MTPDEIERTELANSQYQARLPLVDGLMYPLDEEALDEEE